MQPSYLFYDIESTGLNKCFDQVMQFAAIRTDLDLNEIERHEYLVKVIDDVIPSPGALITHLVSINDANQHGISEYEAIQKIHALLNTPGTISLGYNTLTFDDEFLRFSFWRNLLPPYTHQYANQCGRMDLYPMTLIYHLFQSHVITWPMIDDKPSMKLENLSAANAFSQGQAHNAMVDVEATLALAKALRTERAVWDYLSGYFQKQTEQHRLRQLPILLQQNNHRLSWGLMVLGKIGNRYNYIAPVLNLGTHNHYKNQTLWLRLDLSELETTTSESIEKTTWVFKKKYGEPGLVLPPNDRYLEQVDEKRKNIVQGNLRWCQENPELFDEIVQYHREYKYPVVDNVDAEAALYQADFLTPQEQRWCNEFHRATPEHKSQLIDQQGNPLLQELATRILGRHFPKYLSPQQYEQYHAFRQKALGQAESEIPIDFRGDARMNLLVLERQLQELDQLNLSEKQQTLLEELAQRHQLSSGDLPAS